MDEKKTDLPETEKDLDSTEAEKPKKQPYVTPTNDPDLLIGPYKPIEGEPPTIKCPNCGEEMPTTIDTCVSCGHYLKADKKGYTPMDEDKAKKIRWIIGVICIIAFIIYMILRKS